MGRLTVLARAATAADLRKSRRFTVFSPLMRLRKRAGFGIVEFRSQGCFYGVASK
jgi:hypothetical protein